MEGTERTERLPLAVDAGTLEQIRSAADPMIAAEMVLAYDIDVAVCIIDNLDPLTAAFVVADIRRRISPGGDSQNAKRIDDYVAILTRGTTLRIRGMNGLCHARDEVYRQTGFFAGT